MKELNTQWFQDHQFVPLEEAHGALQVGCTQSNDLWTKQLIELQVKGPVELVPMNAEQIRQYWGEQRGHSATDDDQDILEELNAVSGEMDEEGGWDAKPVIRLVENLLNEALRQQATDIHVEPDEDHLKIRFRKDGMLRLYKSLPSWLKAAVTSRIKVLATLDIAEKRVPQDGRASWDYQGSEVDLRISTLPTRFGEKVVIRLLRQIKTLQRLENLGLSSDLEDRLKYYFRRPQGMIFVTGPTGSGKSSTLYAGLQHVLGREINITTIEDPIEYDLPGANQVQIHEKAGLTFASALRSILRQDPDVILVGEIRDGETAKIAVQAAQTGHLVLSTLHTNDSFSALTRLKDLGVEPFLIGNTVLCVLAQRLVRRICPQCMTWQDCTEIQKNLLPQLPDKIPQAQGCPHCNHTGYRGRIAVFELLMITPEVRQLILNDANEGELRQSIAISSLLDDGISRLRQGKTTFDEIERVLMH